jgi:hypothetical protein
MDFSISGTELFEVDKIAGSQRLSFWAMVAILCPNRHVVHRMLNSKSYKTRKKNFTRAIKLVMKNSLTI